MAVVFNPDLKYDYDWVGVADQKNDSKDNTFHDQWFLQGYTEGVYPKILENINAVGKVALEKFIRGYSTL